MKNAELRKIMINRNYDDALSFPEKKRNVKKFKFNEEYERFGNRKTTNRDNNKRDFSFYTN